LSIKIGNLKKKNQVEMLVVSLVFILRVESPFFQSLNSFCPYLPP
jgi:hypothetical protein